MQEEQKARRLFFLHPCSSSLVSAERARTCVYCLESSIVYRRARSSGVVLLHLPRPYLTVLDPHVEELGFPVLVDVIEIAFHNLVDNSIVRV